MILPSMFVSRTLKSECAERSTCEASSAGIGGVGRAALGGCLGAAMTQILGTGSLTLSSCHLRRHRTNLLHELRRSVIHESENEILHRYRFALIAR